MSLFNQININGVALNGLQGQPTQAFANQFGNIAQMNIQCHPDMKGFLPHIAAYIHNFIAQRASQNLPRAVHFNMLLAQGNAELFIMTTLVANMAYIRVKNGQIQEVAMFAMKYTGEAEDWPEANKRERKWFKPKKAIAKVDPYLAPFIWDVVSNLEASFAHEARKLKEVK